MGSIPFFNNFGKRTKLQNYPKLHKTIFINSTQLQYVNQLRFNLLFTRLLVREQYH
eukprot:c37246_g1_i1 orf=57-224(+)